ncbi:MAG: RidA family protein [Flavobacteriales bacterium]
MENLKKAVINPLAPTPIGPYSPGVRVGNTLFVSGHVPIHPETKTLVQNTMEAATAQVLTNIGKLLATEGFTMDEVVKCTIFLTDLNDFNEVNACYATFFKGIPPARETVEVSRLPLDARIEISCIAIKSK